MKNSLWSIESAARHNIEHHPTNFCSVFDYILKLHCSDGRMSESLHIVCLCVRFNRCIFTESMLVVYLLNNSTLSYLLTNSNFDMPVLVECVSLRTLDKLHVLKSFGGLNYNKICARARSMHPHLSIINGIFLL